MNRLTSIPKKSSCVIQDLEAIPGVPYLFQTPQESRVDLRLFNRGMRSAFYCLKLVLLISPST